jgi:hypothetical protein
VASVHERTTPTERLPFVGEVSAKFLRIEGCRVVSAADPYGCILGFPDQSRHYFFQIPEWTPFPKHYFSENLVVSRIEPGPLDL